MGGSITFSSVYGKGTKFSFTISDIPNPNLINHCPKALKEIEEKKVILPSKISGEKKRILVVDDEAICGHIVTNYCKNLNINVDIVPCFLLIIFLRLLLGLWL